VCTLPEASSFEEMLSGGHPNSLGQTLDVVAAVSATPQRLRELIDTFASADAVVRLRVSSALKRLSRLDQDLFARHLDYYLDAIEGLDQPSAQWTRAQIALEMDAILTSSQRERLTRALREQLERSGDWIVIAQTLKTLVAWAADDARLAKWLLPHAERHAKDTRKTVSSVARRALQNLGR
jgi:hypothetical protein